MMGYFIFTTMKIIFFQKELVKAFIGYQGILNIPRDVNEVRPVYSEIREKGITLLKIILLFITSSRKKRKKLVAIEADLRLIVFSTASNLLETAATTFTLVIIMSMIMK